jgi:glycine/D-amino acid oxidase-like deaminating enzyme
LSGQYLIGSSRELVGFNDEVNRSLVSRMVQKACEFMPGLADLMAIRVWAGFRPATPDKLPLIGKWPTVEGLYIATGHEGLGIATSQGTAALLAAEIVGKVPEIDPAPYRAERVLEKQDA